MQAATICYLILLATIIEKKKLTKPLQLSFAPITFLIPTIYCKYSVIKITLWLIVVLAYLDNSLILMT